MLNTRPEGTTSRTGLGRVARIDVFYRNPLFQSLVFNESLELAESPRVEVSPLTFPLLCSFSNVDQLFHYKYISCLQTVYNGFTDAVVQIAHDANLLTLKAFQEMLCTSSPFGLELAAQLAIVPLNVHRLFTAEFEAVRSNGQVHHTNVNANLFARLSWRINFSLNNNVDIEGLGLFVINEISRAVRFPVTQKRSLELSQDHWHFNSTLDSRDGGQTVFSDRKGSDIETNSGIGAKATWGSTIAPAFLIGFCNFISSGASKLRREIVLFPYIVVNKMVKRHFVRQAIAIMCNLGNVVASITKLVNGFKHCLFLFIPRIQLASHGLRQFWHGALSIRHIGGDVKGTALGPL